MTRLVIGMLTLFFLQSAKAGIPTQFPEDKIITITVNELNQVLMGPDTLAIGDLTKELETRLWKNYVGTGKSYDAIHLNFAEGVSSATRQAVIDAIKAAQKNALKEITLDKHKTIYEDLPAGKRRKIKRHFPVLFQSF